MPRELSDLLCTQEFDDILSNSKITFYYHLPVTADRIKYANEQIIRTANGIENKTIETRLKFGLQILAGFADGSFTVNEKPISSYKASPFYNSAWKEIAQVFAGDLISALALIVFEGSLNVKRSAPETAAAPAPAATDAEGGNKDPL